MAKSSQDQKYDGVICFGGVDWWYHNRGHYDLQMMREFSEEMPVLYVNSIGVRPPRITEGSMFFTRVRRKLKSLFRGLVRIRDNFSVYSPVTFPGGGSSWFAKFFVKWALNLQVKYAAWRCGIKRPLVWVASPAADIVVNSLKPIKIVYQRSDPYEDLEGVDPERVLAFDQSLKSKADVVLFCARELYEAEKGQNPGSAFVDHGVDYEHFMKAGIAFDETGAEPADLNDIPHPRVGFIGGIDAHTFDPELFVEVARSAPQISFVMIGACSLPEGWCPLDNVYLLGQRPYEQVASYMAACDVLIMPWNKSDWIKGCNPVKMKEYLAVGRPVVSTYFPEIEYFKDHISVAGTSEEFCDKIRELLQDPGSSQDRRLRVQDHTWQAKAGKVRQSLG